MASTSRTSTAVATKAQLAHVAFSSGASHFVACTATGLRVFSCKDLVELVHCRCNASGDKVTCSELLTQSNLAAVIRSPNATDGAADVYGVHFMEWQRGQRQRQTTEATMTLGTPGLGAVGGVRLLGDHMLVAGEKKAVLVVNGNGDPQDKEEKPTGPNPLGLCALAIDQATLVYALPREEKGAVQVCRSGSPDSVDVHAHDSSVACIALSCDGRLLATAGSKGTLVRIFSTDDGSKLQEVLREALEAGFLNYHWQYGEKEMQTGGDVRAVRVHRYWTVVVYDRRLCVFGPGEIGAARQPPQIPGRDKNHGILRSVETDENPLGLGAVTSPGPAEPDGSAPFTFACPGAEHGELRVERWVAGEFVPLVISAHTSRINAVALSPDGGLVATASVRGTIVRVFCATDGRLIGELRRGTDRADINCIVFSPDSKWLAVSSDKATVHVFRVADSDLTSSTPESGVEQKQNAPEEGGQAAPAAAAPPAKASTGSSLSFLKGYLPSYFSSEWSLAQFRLPEGVKYSVAFEREKPYTTILIIGTNGSFCRCQFDPVNAGDMVQLEHRKFMKVK
ncbi:hypothetical protein ACQ4PT_061549 [Festuca glaucescens]